jgi:hypothetical protein
LYWKINASNILDLIAAGVCDDERWDGDRFGCPSFPLPEYFFKREYKRSEKEKKKRQ